MRRAVIIGLLVLTLGTTACSSEEDPVADTTQVDQVAAAARAAVDDLAARVGTDPETRQDVITDCVPGNKDSGRMLAYTLRVTVDDGAVDRLRGEIADELAADGWTVKPRPAGNASSGETVDFEKDGTTMGASIFVAKGYAAVSGSGGCVGR